MSYNSFGDPVHEDTHEQVANEIKDRQRTAMPDFMVGVDLYAEGFTLSWCDNDEQRAGWKTARAGEEDEAARLNPHE